MQTILLSGSSGLVGSALVPALEGAGHHVLRLVRREPAGANEIRWSPSARLLDDPRLGGVDVVVNLAGESIGKRWTSSSRQQIRSSRVDSTDTLVGAIGKVAQRPMTLINASAIGFYGNRGNDLLDESQSGGHGFLAEVCREWEASANAAKQFGARVVTMRSGVVLSPKGGALEAMLPPFRLGAGGRLGDGHQWMSWITLSDLVRAVMWLIAHPDISGPVNMTSQNPVTNTDFTAALGKAIHRPAIIPVPAFVLTSLFGEMAEETLLASQRGVPRVLVDSGFVFESPTIDQAFATIFPT